MPDVTVHRHGDRWAVAEAGAASPLQEYDTREAAESAARQLAAGGAVTVADADPTGLADTPPGEDDGEDGGEDGGVPRPPADGMGRDEHLRSEQGGL